MEKGKSLTLEKIKEINPGSISDNMMVARLSRVLNETRVKDKEKANLVIDSSDRQQQSQQPQQELGKLLSQGQNIDEYKQQFKQQYLSQYMKKFGLEEQKPQTQKSAVLTQLERLSSRHKSLEQPVAIEKQNVPSSIKDRFIKAVELIKSPKERPQEKDQEKKSFIRAIIDTIITKGKKLGNDISGYENDRYKAQLQVQDTKQILSIDRKNLQPQQQNPAFKAQKEGANDFKILQNDLSQSEVKDIVELNKQQQQSPQGKLQHQRKEKDKGLDIGD